MPAYNWSVDPFEAGSALRRAAGATDTDRDDPCSLVATAAWTVDGLHYLADLDGHLQIEANEPVLGHEAQLIALAHTRWAVADAITAIDLAAAALGRRWHTHPNSSGREMDFGQAETKLGADPLCGWWIRAVAADHDYQRLKQLRDTMVHRVASKHVTASLATGRTSRAWSIKATQHPVASAIALARDCATRHIDAFLVAAQAGKL